MPVLLPLYERYTIRVMSKPCLHGCVTTVYLLNDELQLLIEKQKYVGGEIPPTSIKNAQREPYTTKGQLRKEEGAIDARPMTQQLPLL